MSLTLTLWLIVFSISSVYFLINPKKGFNSAFLVSFITIISYLIMLEGRFVQNDLYWTRWVFYAFSCSLLSLEISNKIGLDNPKKVYNIFLTSLVMITGALSSVSVGNFKFAFFAISSIAFVILMYNFYKTASKALQTISPYIIFGWSVFPVVFLLSSEGIFQYNFCNRCWCNLPNIGYIYKDCFLYSA